VELRQLIAVEVVVVVVVVVVVIGGGGFTVITAIMVITMVAIAYHSDASMISGGRLKYPSARAARPVLDRKGRHAPPSCPA
jgi:hypothetical protein